jgi:hypothetical protein
LVVFPSFRDREREREQRERESKTEKGKKKEILLRIALHKLSKKKIFFFLSFLLSLYFDP